MDNVKASSFAGSWYPGTQEQCLEFIKNATPQGVSPFENYPKILIMPHAGYRFSGRLAAHIARFIRPDAKKIIIIGPSHRFNFQGLAHSHAQGFDTPLGIVKLDKKGHESVKDFTIHEEQAFDNEHSIEILLPFVRYHAPNAQLLPFVAGANSAKPCLELLKTLWGKDETQIIISTDLSHFKTGENAEILDKATAEKIENCQFQNFTGEMACGFRPLIAALAIAQERAMRVIRIGLTHSGAITGDQSRVVGYGGWVMHEFDEVGFAPMAQNRLKSLATKAIEHQLKTLRRPNLNASTLPAIFQSQGASFVTITKNGRLRGCIGSLKAHRPLGLDIFERALDAAMNDPRFPPLHISEWEDCELSISILSPQQKIDFDDEADLLEQIQPDKDGLWLIAGNHRGTFLPSVWESLPDKRDFWQGVKQKAGLAKDFWAEDMQVFRYHAEKF